MFVELVVIRAGDMIEVCLSKFTAHFLAISMVN
jgi:hypothetical protein